MIKKLLEPIQKLAILIALHWRTRDYKGNWLMFRVGMWIERMIERWKR